MTPVAVVHHPVASSLSPTVLPAKRFLHRAANRINGNSTRSCEPRRQRQPTRDQLEQL
ncbi:hypothetical protein BCR44DRAFT_1423460 [Catenaria anguillulae PL171]|uniref:Uncharacterized protein n=1 Tax=Catenaria anguillulae PL171 TaxID=765915 RepID=A0A1Y2I4E9_9FUNG|nr:hypothetical protein BCR44DRAFT_1423460 [Catenaria anguillulae PL171]